MEYIGGMWDAHMGKIWTPTVSKKMNPIDIEKFKVLVDILHYTYKWLVERSQQLSSLEANLTETIRIANCLSLQEVETHLIEALKVFHDDLDFYTQFSTALLGDKKVRSYLGEKMRYEIAAASAWWILEGMGVKWKRTKLGVKLFEELGYFENTTAGDLGKVFYDRKRAGIELIDQVATLELWEVMTKIKSPDESLIFNVTIETILKHLPELAPIARRIALER